MAAAQVVGKPLTVTEWGVESHGSLAPDCQDMPLYIAGSASMQGWDAVMFYAYSLEPLTEGSSKPSIYQAYNEPVLMASLPAAALLYRRGHVKEASTRYVFEPSKEMLFDHAISAANSVALRTASERGKLAVGMPRVPELPWLDKSVVPPGAKIIYDPRQSQISATASKVVSDSGELRRNWDQGTFTINTPQTQAAAFSSSTTYQQINHCYYKEYYQRAGVENILIHLNPRVISKPGATNFVYDPVGIERHKGRGGSLNEFCGSIVLNTTPFPRRSGPVFAPGLII